MSKHNRQDPIPFEPNAKKQRINDERYHSHAATALQGPASSNSKPRYSAADLLRPRARQNGAATSSHAGTSQQAQQLPSQNAAGDAGSRAASMLLNLHGVTARSSPLNMHHRAQQHHQLAKTGDTGQSSGMRNGMFGNGNGRSTGMLGIPKVEDGYLGGNPMVGPKRSVTPEIQFLDSRFASTASQQAKSSVVDLTNDEVDDEVIYSGTKPLLICYGMIVKVFASISLIPDPPRHLDPSTFGRMWPKIQVSLARGEPRTYIVHLMSTSGKNVGMLRAANAKAMAALMDLGLVDKIQAFILPRYRGFEVAGEPTSQSVEMTITLYGTEGNAKRVGNMLGQHNLFLQDPTDRDPSYAYKNPQYPEQSNNGNMFMTAADRAKLGKASYSMRTTEEVKNEITAVLDSLEKVQVLEETEPPECVMTTLLPHQKQGLNFMIKKEGERTYEKGDDTSFWQIKYASNGRVYHNVITGEQIRTKPASCLGGILADDMGLGKTLTVLSLIVSTFEEAKEFGKQKKDGRASDHDFSVMYAKGTLLICPLSVLVNWEDQIKSHIKPNTFSYYVYHGNNRVSNLKELAKYDLVITTYQLAASDFRGAYKDNKGVLQKVHWFRIVLDEAHTIREQATNQSKAICNLEASRRWAVTGTPVQNRLDDLGTLIKFLRLSPFDVRAQFNQYISAPLKAGDPTSMDKLRVLVDSVALRRRKDKISLPTKHDNTVRLKFTPMEQELYDATSRQSRYKIDMVARQGHLSGKAYVHVLQTILRLRMICASRDLLGDEDTAGLISSNAIDIDSLTDEETHAMGKKQAFEIYNLMKESDEDICYSCQKKVGPANPREGSPAPESEKANAVFGHLTSCPHLFCTDCGPKFLQELLQRYNMGDWISCPHCKNEFRLGMRDLKMADDPALQKDENGRRKVVYRNPSTKIIHLVQDLLDSREKADQHGRIKSVIFSGWTMHLDLIETALENVGIKFTRIDGKMNRLQRADALTMFRDDPDVEAILVSINAGGVGLNLTAASRVYVMEPQFNPAAEAQAIDRVHRLGQEREVFCTRYIMENSFEEKIVALQKKKQRIADVSMSQGKSKKQRAQDKIDDLKELFR